MRQGYSTIIPPLGGLNRRVPYTQRGGQDNYTTPDCVNMFPEGSAEKRAVLGSRAGLTKWSTDQLGKIQAVSEISYIKQVGVGDAFPLDFWEDDFRAYPLTATASEGVAPGLWTRAPWATYTPKVLTRPNQILAPDASLAAVYGPVVPIDTTQEYWLETLLTPVGGKFGYYYIYGLMDTVPDNTQNIFSFGVLLGGATNTGAWTTFTMQGGVQVTSQGGNVTIDGAAKPMLLKARIVKNGSYTAVTVFLDGVQLYATTTEIAYSTLTCFGFALQSVMAETPAAISWYRVQYADAKTVQKALTSLCGVSDGKVFLEHGLNKIKWYTQQYCNPGVNLEVCERGQKLFIADYGQPLSIGTDGVLKDWTIKLVAANGALKKFGRIPSATLADHTTDGTYCTITTTAVHGYFVGEKVTLAGWTWNAGAGVVDGPWVIYDTPTSTTFRIAPTTCPSAASNPGVVGTLSCPSDVATLTVGSGVPDLTARIAVGQSVNIALSPSDPVFDGEAKVTAVTSNTITYKTTYSAGVASTGTGTGTGTISMRAAHLYAPSALFSGTDLRQYAVEFVNVTHPDSGGVFYIIGVDSDTDLYFDQDCGFDGDAITYRVFRAPKVFDPVTGLLSIWRADTADPGLPSVITARQNVNGVATLTLEVPLADVKGNPAVVGDFVQVVSDPPDIDFDGTFEITAVDDAVISYNRSFSVGITGAALAATVVTLTLETEPRFSVGDSVNVVMDVADKKLDGPQIVTGVTSTTITYTGGTGTTTGTTGTVSLNAANQQASNVVNGRVAAKGTGYVNYVFTLAKPTFANTGAIGVNGVITNGALVNVQMQPANPKFDATNVQATWQAVVDTADGVTTYRIAYQTSPAQVATVPIGPLTGQVSTFITSGTTATRVPIETNGFVPPDCPLLTRYVDRMILAAPSTNEGLYFASRQNDPFDFNYGANPADPQRAVDGGTGPAGIVGAPIRAMSVGVGVDAYLLFACDNAIYAMVGDMAIDAMMHLLGSNVGIVGPRAWCYMADGSIVFLSRTGLHMMQHAERASPFMLIRPAFSPPISLSYEKMPMELTNLSSSLYDVSLVYDQRRRGVHIFVTPFATRKTPSFFFDMPKVDGTGGGFWPALVNYNALPFSALMHNSRDPLQADVVVGGTDGYLRRFSSYAANDDGVNFDSYVVIGPLKGGEVSEMGMVKELIGVLSIGSGQVTWTLTGGVNEEQVLRQPSNTATGTWGNRVLGNRSSTGLSDNHLVDVQRGGQNFNAYPRIRGGALALKLASKDNLPFSVESVSMLIAAGGKLRLL